MLHTVIRSTPMQSLIESSYVATDPAGQPLLNRWERGGHRDKPVATASLSGQGRCATRVAAPTGRCTQLAITSLLSSDVVGQQGR